MTSHRGETWKIGGVLEKRGAEGIAEREMAQKWVEIC